jgi:iron(II)-dependent oxidoreductase
MSKIIRRFAPWVLLVLGLLALAAALVARRWTTVLLSVGVILVASDLLIVARRHWFSRKSKVAGKHRSSSDSQQSEDESSLDDSPASGVPADEVESLVGQMLAESRYSLLLRSQIAQNLTPALYEKANDTLQQAMGLVPQGEVHLEPSVFDIDYPLFAADDPNSPMGLVIMVQGVFLDRCPVTNQQYQKFVNAGGYQEAAIWDPEIWPAVLDFTDSTGQPGPRFWVKGRFPPGEAKLPVVGVSWYEAVAYSRWVGKRLPTDAEWVKAASWPVTLSPGTHVQRKYPWGDAMDRRKANVWGSGPNRIVPVEEFSEGVSVGGLYQLIGNVWEWTATNLEIDPTALEETRQKTPAALFKSIRGGAFDTYFENQANCQFASGEHPLLRKHNIGFRCALGICDIAPPPSERNDDRSTSNAELSSELEHLQSEGNSDISASELSASNQFDEQPSEQGQEALA